MLDRIKSPATVHLIFEVDADRAPCDHASDVRLQLVDIGRVSALEIKRDRHIDGVGNACDVGEGEFERKFLAVVKSICGGYRMATGRDRLCSASATDFALPASQMLNRITGLPLM